MPSWLLIRCRRPETRALYNVFCIMGGFYCSCVVTRSAKYAWLVLNIMSTLYGSIIGPVGYLLTTPEIMPSDLLYTVTFAMCHTYASVYTPLVTYYFRDELKTILRNVDDELGCRQPEVRSVDAKRWRYDSVAIARNWSTWMLGLMTTVTMLKPVYVILICGRGSCLDSQRVYVEGTPFVQHIRSLEVYLLISAVQAVHVLFASFIPTCTITFGLMIAYEFHNIGANLSVRLEHVIADTVSKVRSLRRESRAQLASAKMESDMFEQFKVNLSFIVNRYQALTRSVERLRIWIQILCSVNLVNFLVIETLLAYLALDSRCEPLLRIPAAIGTLAMGTLTYGICQVGRIFADINEMLINDIYSTGWYELPPKYRKMVHIFHSQLQKPIQFYAVLVYPVTMATFAQALQFVYSVLNFLKRTNV